MSCIRLNLWRGLSHDQITKHINSITTSVYSVNGKTYGGFIRDYKLSEQGLISNELDIQEIINDRKEYDKNVVIAKEEKKKIYE
jgi:hypothetical protein